MIKPGDVIKHDRFMDVCFLVDSVISMTVGLSLLGDWVNMGFKESWIINPKDPAIISIKHEDLKDWKIAINQYDTCLRYSGWAKI